LKVPVSEFVLEYSDPRKYERGYGTLAYFDVPIAGINCLVSIMSMDPMIEDVSSSSRGTAAETLLLLARDQSDDAMYLHLLVLNMGDFSTAGRKSVVTMIIPNDHPEVLDHLGMEKKKLILQ
jgi:hypothetical protein